MGSPSRTSASFLDRQFASQQASKNFSTSKKEKQVPVIAKNSQLRHFYEQSYLVQCISPLSYIFSGLFTFKTGLIDFEQESRLKLFAKTVFAVWILAEFCMHVLSTLVAYYFLKFRAMDKASETKLELLRTSERRQNCECRPPQVVRWDIIGVGASRMFGKFCDLTLPKLLRPPIYRFCAWYANANLDEVQGDLSSFPSLQEFFTRRLVPGVRPIDQNSELVSPVDGKVVVFGRANERRVEQVKGVTYDIADFLGTYEGQGERGDSKKENSVDRINSMAMEGTNQEKGTCVFHVVIYLSPGDYHRLHSPADLNVQELRHFPGTLFPISPVFARLIPGLFSLNERVVLAGEWKHGAMAYTAVGAYNVGSISMHFDSSVSTNKLSRDFRNPNVRMMSRKLQL